MRIIVTGASGFIGRAACASLAARGHAVQGVVRPGRERAGDLAADLESPGEFQKIVKFRPQAVAHLAAALPLSFDGPSADKAAQANRRMDAEVLNACAVWGIPLVYASSTSVYGFTRGEMIDEERKLAPIGPYAAAKAAGEQLGRELLDDRGIPFTALRINAPYGPGQRLKTVVWHFLDAALSGLPLQYHGSGSRQQDFTFVEDAGNAVACAVESRAGGSYTIAGGSPVTMRELAERIARSVPGCRSMIEPSGSEDPQEGVTARFSIARAAEGLGWRPLVSLDAGLRRCLESKKEAGDEARISS